MVRELISYSFQNLENAVIYWQISGNAFVDFWNCQSIWRGYENIDNSSLKALYNPHIFVEYIINLEFTINRIPNSIEPNIDFWEENKEELMKLRNNPLILEIDVQISSKLIQLRNLDENILKSVEKIREDYRKEYNFTDNEVEPFRGYLGGI